MFVIFPTCDNDTEDPHCAKTNRQISHIYLFGLGGVDSVLRFYLNFRIIWGPHGHYKVTQFPVEHVQL